MLNFKLAMGRRDKVDLSNLHEVCGLGTRTLEFWAEAASVMLHKFHAVPPPPTSIQVVLDGSTTTMSIEWDAPSHQAMADHANEKDATEDGAYAIAVAAAHHHGYFVKRRTHQGSGADLLMTRVGEPDNDFVKLEVSGIARGAALRWLAGWPRSRRRLAQVICAVRASRPSSDSRPPRLRWSACLDGL